MKKKKIFAVILAVVLTLSAVMVFSSCRESYFVSHNISQQADNFNVTRRLAVVNVRTDKPVFELIGNFALSNNSDSELEIIVEVSKGNYKKHFVYLNEWTIYVVEDISGAYVDPYHYEVNFLPEMFGLITIVSED